MTKNCYLPILFATAFFALPSCEPSPANPETPQGATAVFQDFEALNAKNTITDLGGWLNIMKKDSLHTAPLQWVAYADGCNMTVQASAHLYDDSNRGVDYETWLVSPPLDVDHTISKKLSFDIYAGYWNATSSLDVYLLDGLEGTTDPTKRMRLDANMPTSSTANLWLTSSLDFTSFKGTVLVGFCYRAVGGASNSTTFRVDNFSWGDVDEAMRTAQTIFAEPFSTGLGKFTAVSDSGTQAWTFNANASTAPYALAVKISGFVSDARTDANEDWLISEPIDLSGEAKATLTFEQCINKGSIGDTMRYEQTLWVSTDCADPNNHAAAEWTQLRIPDYPTGTSWSFACSGKIDLTPYCGKPNVRLAFLYRCNNVKSANWSIANVKIVR
jgi:hypothetical protein